MWHCCVTPQCIFTNSTLRDVDWTRLVMTADLLAIKSGVIYYFCCFSCYCCLIHGKYVETHIHSSARYDLLLCFTSFFFWCIFMQICIENEKDNGFDTYIKTVWVLSNWDLAKMYLKKYPDLGARTKFTKCKNYRIFQNTLQTVFFSKCCTNKRLASWSHFATFWEKEILQEAWRKVTKNCIEKCSLKCSLSQSFWELGLWNGYI